MKPPKKFIRTAADLRAVKEGATWNEDDYKLFVDWCAEFAIQGQRPWIGKPIELFDYQIDNWFKPLLCWRDHKNDYRFNRATFVCMKKVGKTTAIAAYAGFRAYCWRKSEIFIMSATVRQTDSLFNTLVDFHKQHPELRKRWKIQNHIRTITDTVSGSKIKVAASGSGQVSGPSTDIVILDETAEFGYAAQKTFDRVVYAGAAKPNSQLISISTPSHEIGNLHHKLYLHAKNLINSETDLDTATLPSVIEFPEEEDWQDEVLWKKHLPHLNKTVSIDFYRTEARRALTDVDAELAFRIYLLGQYVRNRKMFVDLKLWAKCKATKPLVAPKSTKICLGLDNGGANDLIGITALIPIKDKIHIKTKAVLSKTALHKKNLTGQTQYQAWVDQGLMEVVDTETIKFETVLRLLEEFYENYDVKALAYDPWQLTDLEKAFKKKKRLTIETPQFGKYLSPLILEFERKIKEETFVHYEEPLLDFCMMNFQVKENKYGKLEFNKENSRTKIDLACSTVIALNALPEVTKKGTDWQHSPVISF